MNRNDILEQLGLAASKPSLSDTLLPALGFMGAGFLIGAGVGVLFAPRRGEDLRRDLGDKLKEGVEGVSASVQQGLEHVADAKERVQQRLTSEQPANEPVSSSSS